MKTKRIPIWSLAMLLSFLIAGAAMAQKVTPTAIFMRHKLGYSQNIVEGIALEHFDLVVTNATRLYNMSQTNVWKALNNPVYRQKSIRFQDDTLALIDAARAKDSRHAIDAYAKVTADCVDCHRTCRREQFVLHGLEESAPTAASPKTGE